MRYATGDQVVTWGNTQIPQIQITQPIATDAPEVAIPSVESVKSTVIPPCPENANRIVFAADVAESGANFELFSMNPDGSDIIKVTDHPGSDEYPSCHLNAVESRFLPMSTKRTIKYLSSTQTAQV